MKNNIKVTLMDCLKNKKALFAFNFSNYEQLSGIIAGANSANSPVICAVSEGAIKYYGLDNIVDIFQNEKAKSTVPVFLHLDHGKDIDTIVNCINAKFDSVMIDASDKSFEENVKITSQIVKLAHKKNVWVESELGVLRGIEESVSSKQHHFTDPTQALEFVQKTKTDSLAIAIGTSHGAYKFDGKCKLEIKILEEIENNIPNIPLVLHGASSLPKKMITKYNKLGGNLENASGVDIKSLKIVCHEHNVCKINSDTDLRLAFTIGIKDFIKNNPNVFDPRSYLKNASEEVKKLVSEKIKSLS